MKPRIFKYHETFYGIQFIDARTAKKRVIFADTLREAMGLIRHGYAMGYILYEK